MNLKSEAKKPGLWFGIIGIGLGALGATKNWPELLWIGVVVVLLTLIVIIIDREIKVRSLKHKVSSLIKSKISLEGRLLQLQSVIEDVFSNVHNLSHKIRDTISDLRVLDDLNEAKSRVGLCISELLTQSSHCLTRVTGSECVSSLMLHANGSLRTYHYSLNAPSDRTGKSSMPLDPDKGIAGQAFQSGDVVFWSKGHPHFVEIRSNGQRFYESGMTIPFRIGFCYAGLLNVDCKKENAFGGQTHRMIGAAFADAIGAASELLILWEEHKK